MRSNNQEEGCRRNDPRSAMQCVALAFRRDGRRSVVTISDMSFSGVQMEGSSFSDDEEFRLVIPHRGDVNARVRWSSPTAAGAQFDGNLHLDAIVPAHESYAFRRLRAFNFASGRQFGRRTTPLC
jgi:hypothetical protein